MQLSVLTSISRRGAAAVAALVVGAALGPFLAVGPAGSQAATTVTARGVALQPSASCRFGDVDVTYAAQGAQTQTATFSAADGTELTTFDTAAYRADYVGTESILTEADTPPAAGTVVAVYVAIGTTPAQASTTGEFFVLYQCDSERSDRGGTNTVLATCVGPYGTCPTTAAEALAGFGNLVPAPGGSTPATPLVATPLFTG